jgi:F-type H+-transporting ATPase subunit a
MMVFLAAFLLAQGQPVPVPDTAHPAAGEHGAAPGHEAAAPGAEHKAEGEKAEAAEKENIADHIFHHVEDEVVVPIGFWVGARYIRLDITKHLINMWIAAGILLIVVGLGARKRALIPKGGYNLLEMVVMFIRDEISVKNIGHHAHLYTNYLCSAFFFILFMNLTGLLPIPAVGGFPGISTATGNISVTVVLALFTFVLTQIAGMRAQGALGYWKHLVPSGVPVPLLPLMFVIEFFGLFTKPFALTVRLFANMVAGHIVIFFLIALTLFISVYVAPVSVAFALGIFMLELFVALVQAYVFTMLSALFIGMTQHAH